MLGGVLKKLILPLVFILLAYTVYAYMRPVPAVTPVSEISAVPKTSPVNLPWPSSGQAALGASSYGVLASHNTTKPVPIGSVAKVFTALAVLQKRPITAGQGPTITLDSTDVDYFNNYYSNDGSVAPVQAGEQITEVQALQAMLLPSANNMADSLARWAFGSIDGYKIYANQMVKNLSLNNTVIGDTNGFSDTTTSTADDLVKLGILAIQNPSLAQIVSQSSAHVPVAGNINNTNFLLGSDGVVGIKTGNTDKAGGCYLFAAQRTIAGRAIKLVGAILGQLTLVSALQAAPPIISASDQGFEQVTVVHKNQTMGDYRIPWGSATNFKSPKDLTLFVWRGQDIKILNEPDTVSAPQNAGDSVGKLTVQSGQQSSSSTLVLSQNLPKPSVWWRLLY